MGKNNKIMNYEDYKSYLIKKTGYASINEYETPTYFDKNHGFVIYKIDDEHNVEVVFMCGDYLYLIEKPIEFAKQNNCKIVYGYMRYNPYVIAKSFKYKGKDLENLIDTHGYKCSIIPNERMHCLITGKVMNRVNIYVN